MVLKTVCLLPRGWTIAEYRQHSCNDRSHSHISAAQLLKLEKAGTARVIQRAGERHDRTIAARTAASVRIAVAPFVRDVSCRVGEEIAIALANKALWAAVMLWHTRRQRRPEAAEVESA